MKIFTLSNYFPNHPGGIEFVALNLVSRWRNNHQVRWAACDAPLDPYTHHEDDVLLAANNFTENVLGFPYPLPTIGSITNIIRQVKWSDVVHFHDCLYLANIVALIASNIYSKPVIITQHIGIVPYKEAYKNILQKLAYQTIGKFVLRRSNEIVFINKNIKNWFETRLGLPKTTLIQNGVNHQIFFPPGIDEQQSIRAKLGYSENDIILLFIGRFTQKKGMDIIHDIAANRPAYKWLILGRGEVDVANWGLPNVTVFPRQHQKTLRDFYIAANLFVLPSKGEGFPGTVQEALACGLPAYVSEEIANSLPDAPLISLDTLSMSNTLKKLDTILKDDNLLRHTSHKSHEYSKNWDWDAIAKEYERHFSILLDKFIEDIQESSNINSP